MQEKTTEVPGEFIIGIVGKTYRKFERLEVVPAGTSVLDREDLDAMSKEELEEVYANIAGTDPKVFPSWGMALANVLFQVEEMRIYHPEPEQEESDEDPKVGKQKRLRGPDTYTLLVPLSDKAREGLAKLPRQARECLNIMLELASSKDSFSFSEKDLKTSFEGCKERLATRQEPWRILQYYRKDLEGAGIVQVS
jgi:hypothetical protein